MTASPIVPPLSPGLARLREQVMARRGSFVPPAGEHPFALDVALWRASTPERSVVQQRAGFLLEQVRLATLRLPPDWHLAGEHLPRVSQNFAFAATPEPDPTPLRRDFGLDDAGVAEVRACVHAWLGRGPGRAAGHRFAAVGEAPPEQSVGRGGWGGGQPTHVYWANGWMENHSVRDYAKVLRLGFAGIRREVERHLARADLAHPDHPQRENFWRAALLVCDAGVLLGQRYAELAAAQAAAATDPAERARLAAIATLCRRVPARPARTLAEATQALWLAHLLTCGEDGINANSFGRLDQVLQPYYAADRAAGRLDEAGAVALMAEFACKLYLDYDVQAITLGGCDARGRQAANAMSHIILAATERLGFVRDLSVRLSRQSPPAFLEQCAAMIARGGGIPYLFNDECFIPALHRRGIPLRAARDYAIIGCIELTIPGPTNPHAVSGWFNGLKCLELALNDGRDPRSDTQLGPRTGAFAAMRGYDDLFAAYRRQVEHFSGLMVYHCNRGELRQRERGPLPCWSLLTDDCIRRGRDITDGGARYQYHSICFLGTANVADALLAVRRLVFEERRVAPAALLAALRADFAGYEPLRQMLLHAAPKYGNDQAEVDEVAAAVARHFIGVMDRCRSPLGGRYFVHLFTFVCNLPFGQMVGATPDGRRAGEPLAYSLSAHQGRDTNGVTAMLRSLARLPHREAAGATAAIIDLDSALVAEAGGPALVAQLIRTGLALGVGQMQWNVTTVERLRQAQRDPEHYGNLAVRVAGYSQMFKLVPPDLQEHIIARTKHRL